MHSMVRPSKIAAILTCFVLLLANMEVSHAQKPKGSRLDLNKNAKASERKSALKFENGKSVKSFGKPSQLNFDTKSSTLSKQYFSKLLTAQNQKVTAEIENIKVSTVEAPKAAVINKPLTEKLDSKDLFYSNDLISVSNVYPNPVDQMATFNYQLNALAKTAKIEIYNVLGSSTNNGVILDKSNKKATIDCRSLKSGIYFYQLILNGKTVATKKLLIRHAN
jgi:hypothetical protein